MTGSKKGRWRIIAEKYPCTTCNAAPLEPCLTNSGNVKTELHTARTNLASKNGWKDPDEREDEDR